MSHPDMVAARDAYAKYANVYDALNAHPGYRRWIEGLESLARRHGLRGRRALDLGCGTGESLVPLIDAGYQVTGADAAPEMLEVARAKVAGRAELVVADIGELPRLGEFDYITCLNDPLNYLATASRLAAALAGMATNAAPGAIVLFDTNNPATFTTAFAGRRQARAQGRTITWHGRGCDDHDGRLVGRATIHVAGRDDGGALGHDHVQYFHPDCVIRTALRGAGLRLVARFGQHDDGSRDAYVDPALHTKTIWLATPLAPMEERR